MNSRKLTNALLYIILFLMVGFLVYYLFFIHGGEKTTDTATTTPSKIATSTTATTSAALYTITAAKLAEHNTDQYYSINASYPQLSGMTNTVIQAKINSSIHAIIQSEATAFKESLSGGNSDISEREGDEDTFQATYATTSTSLYPNILGIALNESFFSSGAAHPSNSILSLNYKLDDGSKINLADLFKKGSNFIRVISDYSIKALDARLGADTNISSSDTIAQGAGPVASNFTVFFITDKGLDIVFTEYQVAAYAAGAQHVVILWSSLASILDPSGPIKP